MTLTETFSTQAEQGLQQRVPDDRLPTGGAMTVEDMEFMEENERKHKMTHSPLPWTWQTANAGPEDQYGCTTYGAIDPLTFKSMGYYGNPELMDANGEPVLSAGTGEYKPYRNAEDAVFIAKACNMHDELVAALKATVSVLRTFRNVPKEQQDWTSLDDEALDYAFQVLDRAQPTGTPTSVLKERALLDQRNELIAALQSIAAEHHFAGEAALAKVWSMASIASAALAKVKT
jgi:hypothetical protein